MIRLPALAVPLLLASLPTSASIAAPEPQDLPMVVTTDTPAYCQNLSDRLRARGRVPDEVGDLAEQGRDLCRTGHVRSGINRLRRALVVLQAGQDQHAAAPGPGR